MRYDACIIGAGAEGLAAAATLAARGLTVVVVEREPRPGGRCVTREFHPGFFASPFTDELPAIPPEIFRSLDLARRGAIFQPAGEPHALTARGDALRRAVIARALSDAARPASRALFAAERAPWPGEELASLSLDAALGETAADARSQAMSAILAGRVCDPALSGSALQLLAGAPGGMVAGGLGRLGEALRAAAEQAGVVISLGLEVSDIKRRRGRVTGVGLADASEIAARAVISTLDLKRTFLSLFKWSELPPALVERVGALRAAPGVARLLVALDAPPAPADAETLRGPIYAAHGSPGEALGAWRGGAVPQRPPAMLRTVSALDPSLAPAGKASLTVTLGAIPHTPFDGAWTKDKRDRLRDGALAAAEAVFPGIGQRVLGTQLIVPPDIENALGTTDGDLCGGAFDADQMLGLRPFADGRGTRTALEGLYLAGASSALGPIASCASGVAAARAVLADLAAGKL